MCAFRVSMEPVTDRPLFPNRHHQNQLPSVTKYGGRVGTVFFDLLILYLHAWIGNNAVVYIHACNLNIEKYYRHSNEIDRWWHREDKTYLSGRSIGTSIIFAYYLSHQNSTNILCTIFPLVRGLKNILSWCSRSCFRIVFLRDGRTGESSHRYSSA